MAGPGGSRKRKAFSVGMLLMRLFVRRKRALVSENPGPACLLLLWPLLVIGIGATTGQKMSDRVSIGPSRVHPHSGELDKLSGVDTLLRKVVVRSKHM